MKLSFWQFVGILLAVAAIWYLIFYWGDSQDGREWIKSMNDFFFSSEDDVDKVVEKQQNPGRGRLVALTSNAAVVWC